MRSRRLRVETIVLALIGLGVFIYVPQFTNQFTTFEWANVAFFFIAIMGLNFLTGYSGQISLGNGAFMAVGGYTTALIVYWLPRFSPALNPSVLAFNFGLAVVTGLLCGLVPAWQAWKRDVNRTLQATSRLETGRFISACAGCSW